MDFSLEKYKFHHRSLTYLSTVGIIVEMLFGWVRYPMRHLPRKF
jgi:hypothetical protein